MITRRGFLAGTGAAFVLAACSGGDGDEPDEPTTTTATTGGDPDETTTSTTAGATGEPLVLGEAFDRNGMLIAGIDQRAPFVLFQESGGLVRYAAAPASLEFIATAEDGEALEPIIVPKRGEDVERPYYPLITRFPSPGTWTLRTEANGQQLESTVLVNETVAIPQTGQPLPSVPTPTTADALGVSTICTRTPACPFHELSLDAVLAAGREVAVLISTPAYCQVGICGPVLDLLIAEAANHPDLAVVHIEVYSVGAPPNPPTPLVTNTFALPYEPVLFVADATGQIAARLDNIYDGTELAEVLSSV